MKAVLPKHLTDIEAIELIWGPPETILGYGDFRPYQRWMAKKMLDLPGVYVGADMGLGKTGATLWAIKQALDAGEIKQALIIAPLYVAEETWPEEIQKWDFARGLKYRVVTGTEEERIAALRLPGNITIINRENLLWLLKKLGLRRWVFDMIVYDEGSRLKRGVLRSNPKPRKSDGKTADPRLTELGVLDRVRFRTKKIVILSGTPAPNGLIDIYGPIFAIDGGERLGTSMTAYKTRWFVEDMYTKKITPHEFSEAEILGRVEDIFYTLSSEDYLKLPKLIEVDHNVRLSAKAMSIYRELEREMAVEVKGRWGEPELIEAVNNGVLTGKLLQCANGSLYDSEKVSHSVHTEKLDVLESIYEEANGRPILVAYSFQFDKDAIKKRFPFVRVFGEGKNDKRDWNAGKIRMMMLHPASAGHGLNFQFGSNIAVWYGLTWSLELYQQFVKRLWRSGQKEDRVFLHRILAAGTADYDVLGALTARDATQSRITAAVKARLDEAQWQMAA